MSLKLCKKKDLKRKANIVVDEVIYVISYMSESDEPDKLPFWNKVKMEIELF